MLRRHHAWLGVGLLLVVPSLLIALRPGLARMALAWVRVCSYCLSRASRRSSCSA